VAAAGAIGFGAGVALGAFAGDGCCGWGWNSWDCNWHGGAVVYNHNNFYGNTAWHGGYYNGGYHDCYGYHNDYNRTTVNNFKGNASRQITLIAMPTGTSMPTVPIPGATMKADLEDRTLSAAWAGALGALAASLGVKGRQFPWLGKHARRRFLWRPFRREALEAAASVAADSDVRQPAGECLFPLTFEL
jgi:hypothetical protein